MSETIEDVIPEEVAVAVRDVQLFCKGVAPSQFTRDETLIAAKWRERCSSNPHLFNGTVFLQSELRLEQGQLSGKAVELDYASFMHWRGNLPFQSETNLTHVFPLAAIESCEGHLIAVRSAPTTVNSGLIYFAAGMFDDQDVIDGRLDLYGNMAREVREETGLELKEMHSDGALTAFRNKRFLALFQRFMSEKTSDELEAVIRQHIAVQAVPEIDDVVVIAGTSDISEKMPHYMQSYCHWVLRGRK
jgi:8-oxo-dGTP pyrophosphatase MutT (NUDIX family)